MSNQQTESKGCISVIIPVFCVEKYIEECIQSVLKQTYKDFEIILVDDVGKDSSITIATNLLRESDASWTILTHERNRGLSAARNTAVDVARGEFLYFLDSDDYISEHCLEVLINEAHANGADMVFGNIRSVWEGVVEDSDWTRPACAEAPKDPQQAHYMKIIYPMAWNRLIRRDFYNKSGVQFIEGILHEDEPWSFSLMMRTNKISIVNDITYYYRTRTDSITGAGKQHISLKQLEGKLTGLIIRTKEAKQFKVTENEFFIKTQFSHVYGLMTLITQAKVPSAEKKRLLNSLFADVIRPLPELQRIHTIRLSTMCKAILPGYWWLHVLIFLRRKRKGTKNFTK